MVLISEISKTVDIYKFMNVSNVIGASEQVLNEFYGKSSSLPWKGAIKGI